MMSCNGCRVLRKGCSEDCMLRHCLEVIDNPRAQANATVFVAKFCGRAGLMAFISSVPRNQRPSLFQSLLFEAVGRAVNPTTGAMGLLWSGNWHQCQTAVMSVLRGGTIEFQPPNLGSGSGLKSTLKRKRLDETDAAKRGLNDLHISLINRRAEAASEESETTTSGSEVGCTNGGLQGGESKLLRLFI